MKTDQIDKFREALDALVNDFNIKVEEFRINLQNFSSDVQVQVQGQRENLHEYGEKLKSKLWISVLQDFEFEVTRIVFGTTIKM